MPKLKPWTPATHRVMSRWPLMAQAMIEGKTAKQISTEVLNGEIGVDAVYKQLRHPGFREYLDNAINDSMVPLFIEHADKIKDLWTSKDPQDRRLAVVETGRMMRHVQGSKSVQRNENYNLSVSQDRTEIRELLEAATPDEQQVIIKVFNRIMEKPRYVEAEISDN